MAFSITASHAKATADWVGATATATATEETRRKIQDKIENAAVNQRYSESFSKDELPGFFSAYQVLKTELTNNGFSVSMSGENIIISWS